MANTGHQVAPNLVRERYRWPHSNLRRTVERFDQLEVLDDSRDDRWGMPDPVEQCCLEGGKVASRLSDPELAGWCRSWLKGVEQSGVRPSMRS